MAHNLLILGNEQIKTIAMGFTVLWMILYCLCFALVINLTNLISHAFSRKNMVQDPFTGRTHHEVPNPGLFPLNYEQPGLKSGTFLSFYSVLVIFSFVGLTIVAFIYANHWWQIPIVSFLGNLVSNIYSKNLPLRLHICKILHNTSHNINYNYSFVSYCNQPLI